MKRQHHGMSVNTEKEWPIEDLKEKIDILHESGSEREIRKPGPSTARRKLGLNSEHYHRAVAQMAYWLWEKRGRPSGSAETDWVKAEAALKPFWSADLSFDSGDSASTNPGKL